MATSTAANEPAAPEVDLFGDSNGQKTLKPCINLNSKQCLEKIEQIFEQGKTLGVTVPKDSLKEMEKRCKEQYSKPAVVKECVIHHRAEYLNNRFGANTPIAKPLLIGGIAGGIVLLLLIFTLIYCICCRKGGKGGSKSGKSKKSKKTKSRKKK